MQKTQKKQNYKLKTELKALFFKNGSFFVKNLNDP